MKARRLRGRGWRGLLGVALALVMVAAACGDDADVATTTTATVADTTTTTSPTPAAVTCPGERSTLSDDWAHYRLFAEYVFFHPVGWVVALPEVVPAEDVFHADILAEAGVGPEAEVSVLTVADPSPAGVPGVILVTIAGVTSPLEVLYARQEEHILSSVGTDLREVLGTGASGCLGDEPALGLALLFDDSVVQVWSAVRAGTLYVFLLVAEDESRLDVLDEVLRSWAWEDDAPLAAPDACRPDPPSALSAGWARFHVDDYAFSYPADWLDWAGVLTIPLAGLLDDATYAETGLGPDATFAPTLVRDPTGFPNVVVVEFGGVASSLDEVHARVTAHMEAKEEVRAVTASRRDLCVGGEWAASLELEFLLADDEILHQENWYVIHGGSLYLIQALAEDSAGAAVLHELLRTWEWRVAAAPPLPGEAADVFVWAYTATEADTSLDAPDPTTFTSVFAAGTTRVYAVFGLEEGAFGGVLVTWIREGAVVLEHRIFYTSITSWFAASISNRDGSALDPGDWTVRLEMEDTGERVELAFRIEGD